MLVKNEKGTPQNKRGPKTNVRNFEQNQMQDIVYHQACGNGVDQLLIKAMRY